MEVLTMDGIEIEYRNRNRSGHWFDTDTLRFFKTRLGALRVVRNIWLFISSEKGPHGPRAYTVRRMDEKGNIDNVGEFMEHTRSSARSALKRAAEQEQENQSE